MKRLDELINGKNIDKFIDLSHLKVSNEQIMTIILVVYKVGVKGNLNNFQRKLWISYSFGRLVDL